jgi:hypothetical protein
MREVIGINSQTSSSRFPQKPLETLTGARTITVDEIDQYQGFAFDPGGSARTVTLPAEAASKGAFVTISNEADAAEIITIENDGTDTIVTPTQNEAAILWCDGTSWYGMVGASS